MVHDRGKRTLVVRGHSTGDLDIATRWEIARRWLEKEHGLLGGVIAELLDVFRVVAAYRDYLASVLSLPPLPCAPGAPCWTEDVPSSPAARTPRGRRAACACWSGRSLGVRAGGAWELPRAVRRERVRASEQPWRVWREEL